MPDRPFRLIYRTCHSMLSGIFIFAGNNLFSGKSLMPDTLRIEDQPMVVSRPIHIELK
jgi:hypothetical protein